MTDQEPEDISNEKTPQRATRTNDDDNSNSTPLTKIVSDAAQGDTHFNDHYTSLLKEAQADAQSLLDFSNEEFEKMGVKLGAMKRLQRAANEYFKRKSSAANFIFQGTNDDPERRPLLEREHCEHTSLPMSNEFASLPTSNEFASLPMSNEFASLPTSNEFASLPMSNKFASLPTSNNHLEEIRNKLHIRRLGNRPATTLSNALSMVSYYNTKVRKEDEVAFHQEEPDNVVYKFVDYLLDHEGLSSKSKHKYLRDLTSIFRMKQITISNEAKELVLQTMRDFHSEGMNYYRSGDNNANFAITDRDCLHLINSTVHQCAGGK